MDLARVRVEESMREPTPESIRNVSARLGPEAGAQPVWSRELHSGDVSPIGQQFDIFSREPRPKTAAWIVCWSDLMMTMFIMFAALYAFQAPMIQFKSVTDQPVRVEAGGTAPVPVPAVESLLGRIHDRVRDMIERSGLERAVSVRLVPDKTLHVTLAGDLLFGPGGSSLRPEAKGGLLELADILRSAPHSLAVVGHAAQGETIGDAAAPWRLSSARAMEVAMFLVAEAGFPPDRMFVTAYGDQRPVRSADGVQRSRRVDLVLCAENPTEPLPAAEGGGADGFRRWVAAASQGGE
jgi:outer membrane protein OmpA-like peptidoglycan-associated protein